MHPLEQACPGQPVYPVSAQSPDGAVVSECKAADSAAEFGRQASGRIRAPGYSPRDRIQPVESAGDRADPDAPVSAFEQTRDATVGQTRVGARGKAELFKVVTVETVQAVFGADPQEALAVLKQRRDAALGETVVDGIVAETGRLGAASRGVYRECYGEADYDPDGRDMAAQASRQITGGSVTFRWHQSIRPMVIAAPRLAAALVGSLSCPPTGKPDPQHDSTQHGMGVDFQHSECLSDA